MLNTKLRTHISTIARQRLTKRRLKCKLKRCPECQPRVRYVTWLWEKQSTSTYVRSNHESGDDHCCLLAKQIARREELYSDFIGESARLLVDAMQHNSGDLEKLLPLYALVSRIRLSSSKPVLAEAENLIRTILATYPQPNLTVDQIEARALNGDDPLRQFSDTCRTELDLLQQNL